MSLSARPPRPPMPHGWWRLAWFLACTFSESMGLTYKHLSMIHRLWSLGLEWFGFQSQFYCLPTMSLTFLVCQREIWRASASQVIPNINWNNVLEALQYTAWCIVRGQPTVVALAHYCSYGHWTLCKQGLRFFLFVCPWHGGAPGTQWALSWF